MNLTTFVLGVFGVVLNGYAIIFILKQMASVTRKCSGKATYAEPPTILSEAYSFVACDGLSDPQMRDLEKFIFYVNKSKVGGRLLGLPVDTEFIIKFTAGGSVFMW